MRRRDFFGVSAIVGAGVLAAVPAGDAATEPETGMEAVVLPIRVRRDNYTYLLRERSGTAVGLVDAGEAAPVIRVLDILGLRPTHIFSTHHHEDHVAGNAELAERYGARVFGSAIDRDRIPALTDAVGEGDEIAFGAERLSVMLVPGHTRGHVAYLRPAEKAVFTGDTLFVMGCGRLFEGTAAEMWESLKRLRALPGDTRVYCGHEYAAALSRIALSLDPENRIVMERAIELAARREAGKPSVPSTIGAETRTNPYLRLDDPAFQAVLGLPGAEPPAVFEEVLRRRPSPLKKG